MNKREQNKSYKSNVSLLMASHTVTDGGCIYIEKQTKFLFGEVNTYILSSADFVLGFATRFFLGRVLTKIRRLALFRFLFKIYGDILVSCHFKRFLTDCEYNDTKQLVCVSEDIISLAVASLIKKSKPDIKIHFSMLDLPWSYKSQNTYKQALRHDFINLFLKNVDTADFTTKEMAKIFEEKGFTGRYMITFSGIDLIDSAYFEPNSIDSIDENFLKEKNFVYAGGIRALKELFCFCNVLENLSAMEKKDYRLHLYSSGAFAHSVVNFYGFVPPKEITQILQDYSYGLVPMSFDESDNELVETSFPSKAWLYLNNGIIPIVIAPANAGICKLMNKYSFGIVISDTKDISSTLKSLNWIEEYKLIMSNYKSFQSTLNESFRNFREELSITI